MRVWNVDKMASFGRLVGAAHSSQSEVSCLSVSLDAQNSGRILIIVELFCVFLVSQRGT